VVTASQVIIQDSRGERRVVLGFDPNLPGQKAAGIFIYDPEGKTQRAWLSHDQNGSPGMGLTDKNGKRLLNCVVDVKEQPAVIVNDAKETRRGILAYNPGKGMFLQLFDKQGTVVPKSSLAVPD
jgi:hypothetical protein